MIDLTTQDNIKNRNRAKIASDVYYDIFDFKIKPVSNKFIDNLALELINWALKDEDALKLSQFLNIKGIYFSDFYRWIEKNENLKKAHQVALSAIGNRREIGALKKKFDSGIIASSMPHYDNDWKELAKWRASLKNNNGKDEPKNIVVVMQQIPETDEVKKYMEERKIKDAKIVHL